MFPEPTELLLIGFFDRNNLDPKIQIKYIDTKNQLEDILTKGNFTRDEWTHLLSLFTINRFNSTNCSEMMSKRTQKDSGEERVTAKSKLMLNLVSRCSVRDPDVLASTASESPVKTRYESQILLSLWNEQQPRTVRRVMGASSSDYSEWNIDEKWSSQEWTSDEMLEAIMQPFTQHTDRLVIDDDDMDSNTATESDLSLRSRSFLNRVNDRVRKIQDQSSKDATQDSDKHSVIWGMFMSSTLEASVSMGKNYSENKHSIKNTGNNLTLKQMFDIFEKLIVGQSAEIFEVTPINWEDSSWNHLSLVNDEEVTSLSHAKVYVCSDPVLCLGKVNQNPTSNSAWEEKLSWFKSSSEYRALDTIDGEPMEFELNMFPGFTTLQLCNKVHEFMIKMGDPSQFQGRIIFMSMFNDILWRNEDNEKECLANATLVS